jgi:flagellar protein FliL
VKDKITPIAIILGFLSAVLAMAVWASGATEIAKQNKQRMAAEQAAKLLEENKKVVSYVDFEEEIYAEYRKSASSNGMLRVDLKIQVDTTEAKVRVEENRPLLESKFVDLIRKQPVGALRSIAGREKLRAEATTLFQKEMKDLTGKSQVKAVFFSKYDSH